MKWQWLSLVVVVFSGLLIIGWMAWPESTQAPAAEVSTDSSYSLLPETPITSLLASVIPTTEAGTKQVRATDIAGADDAFTFTAAMPAQWQAEAVAGSQAISLYDPQASGAANLDRSQIFIRFFRAFDFLTLSTVNIVSRTELTLNDRPVVRYEIEKKPTAALFPSQPSWRNERHIVTDIRVSDANPAIFYVIAQRPDLAPEIYDAFLQSMVVNGAKSAPKTSLVTPVTEFRQRITKKPFGIFITPDTSPVQPERFSGWHTGVDVEFADVTAEVPVQAVADGKVVAARTVAGYGGVIAIQHTINDQALIGIYGHLNPNHLPAAGTAVAAATPIGILGQGGTAETDGERKHLHFALRRGAEIDWRGYVTTKEELASWLNPLSLEF